MSVLGCEFFWYKSLDASILPPPYTNQTEGYVGILRYKDEDGKCQFYDGLFLQSNDFNNMFVASQFAAVVGPAAAFLALSLNTVEWLCCRLSCTYILAFLLLFLAFSAQALTFLIYGQDEFWYAELVVLFLMCRLCWNWLDCKFLNAYVALMTMPPSTADWNSALFYRLQPRVHFIWHL